MGDRAWVPLCTMLLLCACILAQMLGVPAPLLDAGLLPDTFGASVFEGLTLPISTLLSCMITVTRMAGSSPPHAHVLLLPHSLFHPPVGISSRP